MQHDLEEILMELDDSKFCNGCLNGDTVEYQGRCHDCEYEFSLNSLMVWRSNYRSIEDK